MADGVMVKMTAPTEPEKPDGPGKPGKPDNSGEGNMGSGTVDSKVMPFTDIRKTDWFYEDVAFVFANGLFNGISQNEFAPHMTMSRAMLVTVLYRMHKLFGAEGGEETAYENPFDDVPDDKYYTEAVKWAAANGIVAGKGNGTFDPNGEITREQLAAILYRYMQYAGIEYEATDEYITFEDESSISNFAKEAVQVMNKSGIIRGKGNGKIAPKSSATRAEVAAMLHRFVKLLMLREKDA